MFKQTKSFVLHRIISMRGQGLINPVGRDRRTKSLISLLSGLPLGRCIMHYILSVLSVRPMSAINSETENHTMFNFKSVTHIRSNLQSNFEGGQHIVLA